MHQNLHRSTSALLLTLAAASAMAIGAGTAARAADAASSAPVTPRPSVEAHLKETETLFRAGDFDGAAKRVNDLLVDEAGLAPAERGRLYLMKARLETAFSRKQEVRLWIEKAFQADPTLTPDPVLDPPALQSAWEDVKRGSHSATKDVGRSGRGDNDKGIGVATGLLPFGFGHMSEGRYRDGALFLSSELLFLLASNTLTNGAPSFVPAGPLLASATFAGLYGYEVGDRLGDIAKQNPDAAATLHSALSLFPLGAAQAKNGDGTKALAFAAAQSALLTAAALSPKDGERRMALAAFAVTWAFSIVDGFANDHGNSGKDSDKSAAAMSVMPLANGGAMLTVTITSR